MYTYFHLQHVPLKHTGRVSTVTDTAKVCEAKPKIPMHIPAHALLGDVFPLLPLFLQLLLKLPLFLLHQFFLIRRRDELHSGFSLQLRTPHAETHAKTAHTKKGTLHVVKSVESMANLNFRKASTTAVYQGSPAKNRTLHDLRPHSCTALMIFSPTTNKIKRKHCLIILNGVYCQIGLRYEGVTAPGVGTSSRYRRITRQNA